MKLQILTTKNSWFYRNKHKIPKNYKKYLNKNLINSHLNIKKNYDITIVISYYKIIPKKYLYYSRYNLVVHESDLPKGRGMSPLYWQILNGKTKIVFSLFECSEKMDSGKYYLKKSFYFDPTLIYEEIKEKQVKCAFTLIDSFLIKFSRKKNVKSYFQKGKATYFSKISNKVSELNINKSIKNQINKIRTRDNKNFPACFYYKKRKYIIKLY